MRRVLALAVVSLAGCGSSKPPTIMGYRYFPVSEGTLEHRNADDTLDVLTVGSESASDPTCATGAPEIAAGDPPEWAYGNEPRIYCSADGPNLRLVESDREQTSLDWPSSSGTYTGTVDFGGSLPKPFDFEVSIEEDEGNLTPIPEDRLAGELEATSADYFRRYRITATIDCEETELPCEGSWELDVVYEQPRERVWWLYPIEE